MNGTSKVLVHTELAATITQERALNWGSIFPGSIINVYEWTENLVPPELYDGEGYIGSTLFITETRGNDTDGKPKLTITIGLVVLQKFDKTRANAGKKRPYR